MVRPEALEVVKPGTMTGKTLSERDSAQIEEGRERDRKERLRGQVHQPIGMSH